MKAYISIIFLLFALRTVIGQSQKPNIIFIMTDDQSSIPLRDSDSQNQSRPFGFNGDSKVYTPIIDDLASKGIVFDNAFVSSSICSPSRYSILTGKYAGRSEGNNFISNFPLGKLSRVANNIELEENITNLPRLLKTVGYKTAFIGKSHIIDHDILETYTQGTDGFMPYSKTANPYNADVSNAIKFNHDKWSTRMKQFGFDYVNAFYPGNLRELFNDDLNIHNVEYKNKAVLDFIDNTGNEPFFIYYSETIPHGPAPYWTNGNGYYAGLDADINITAEGVLNQDYSYLSSRVQIKNEVSGIPGKDPSQAWLRWFDYAVGAVVEKLRQKGKLDNTLIVITSDHGDYNNAKATNYEGGIKVPLMVYWPNGITHPRTYNELVQNIDFTPTFLDLAGVNTSGVTLDGKSLKNVITTNTNDVVHDYLFFEIGYSRAIRTKDWKYITVRYDDATKTKIANGDTFNGPNGTQVPLPYYIPNVSLGSLGESSYPLYNQKDQLFDLTKDPYETRNLFELNPSKSTEMRNLLRSKLLTFPNRPYQEFTNTNVDLTITTEVNSIMGKVLTGYQGWFNAEGDGANAGWKHYKVTVNGIDKFEPGFVSVDFWPDMSEADADEKFSTPFTRVDGSVGSVFSSTNAKTVNRHFKWMNDYGIDGVFFQQFASNLKSNAPKLKANDIVVFDNIIASSIANNNRLVSIMYDLSGSNATGTMVNDVKQHWIEMVNKHGVNDPTKAHILTYNKKPVVAIWGVGFNRVDNYNLNDVQDLINFFKNDQSYGGCSVMLGVPQSWRTLNGDATSNTQLHDVIKSADIVHPWTVGRYSDINGADNYRSVISADKAWCDAENLLYMPVVFPGFSWQNLKFSQGIASDLNSIPRLKGDFLWQQFYNDISENVATVYVAMFDEMDEGTCIFKVDNDPPAGLSKFTNYEGLPNDYYLWLTGKGREMLRGDIPLSNNKPIYPNLPEIGPYYMRSAGSDSNTGTSPGTAFRTMSSLDKVPQNKVLKVLGNVVHNRVINITKSITIEGESNAVLEPNINRVGNDGMFTVLTPNLNVSFRNMAFKNNALTLQDGAVFKLNSNSNLFFTDCVFEGNSTAGNKGLNGGAVSLYLGNLNLQNCLFNSNAAEGSGGAIFASGNGVLDINDSFFINNSADNPKNTPTNNANGGGISVGGSFKTSINRTTFYNNSATLQGGALYFSGTDEASSLNSVTVYANMIADSNIDRAGGVRIEGNRPFTITNSLIYGNTSNSEISDVGITIYNSTTNPIRNGIGLTVNKSIIGAINGFSEMGEGNLDINNGSVLNAVLSKEYTNLTYDSSDNFVKFQNPMGASIPIGENSPIEFVSTGLDAGHWQSEFRRTLSNPNSNNKIKAFLVQNDKTKNIINIINYTHDDIVVNIYNMLGQKVIENVNVKKQKQIHHNLSSGIYILTGNTNKGMFSKKFPVQN